MPHWAADTGRDHLATAVLRHWQCGREGRQGDDGRQKTPGSCPETGPVCSDTDVCMQLPETLLAHRGTPGSSTCASEVCTPQVVPTQPPRQRLCRARLGSPGTWRQDREEGREAGPALLQGGPGNGIVMVGGVTVTTFHSWEGERDRWRPPAESLHK